jgi:uncharacterized protein YidB (DUF937 family)
MGLLDILNGMQNGPRGQRQPSSSSGGGMSPLTMALLGLLAYKALKHFGGQAAAPGAGSRPTPLPPGGTTAPAGGTTTAGGPGGTIPVGTGGGGLGDILGGLLGGKGSSMPAGGKPGASLNELFPGGLGGLLGGAAAGGALSAGLDKLIRELQESGHGDAVNSWIGHGENKEIAPSDLGRALGGDTIATLAEQTGMTRGELLDGLSQQLPELIDQLTPHGRVPTAEEAARLV